jgi:A/G-specific adenine glycosylase
VAVRRAALAFFDTEGRSFPFRGVADPWAILVSEVMAQQTQAARAAEAWRGFMTTYPTPAVLADAPTADVLRAWRGLGYNRRAVSLQRAAAAIVAEHGGRVPSDVASLERLPGVGPYTARAVASLAFETPVGAVDTNVRRVLSRLVGAEPGSLPARDIQALADAMVDPARPGDWTLAVMDVGATRCRPVRPDCPRCPLRSWCRTARARALGDGPGARSARRPPATRDVPFQATSRWLRGRIVERLRDATAGAWIAFDAPIGDHDRAAVGRALEALAVDGLLEHRAGDPPSARLPLRAGGTLVAR